MKKQKEQKEQHPILNQVLNPEFLEKFKDSGELNSFMEQLYARAMEQMLEGEMDSHLGYEKHYEKQSKLNFDGRERPTSNVYCNTHRRRPYSMTTDE